ncbi:MAG: hypothetical protein HY898_34005 [Deltaproteobacteria bacterium]|nr:hypothetical protein [Deltaproteobacteria bacterium]
MNGLKFHIRQPDGRIEEMVIDSDRVLIGSGAHCEIRLPVEESAVEHVAIQVAPEGIAAQARASQPYPTINGAPFAQTQVLPGAILGVGRVQIQVTLIEVLDGSALGSRKKSKTSTMTYVLALLAMPLAAYLLLADDEEAMAPKPPSSFPELWDAPITSCPQQSAEQALTLASDKLALANSRRERRPFRVQDGVAAVPLYELAAACFRMAEQTSLAREASEAAQSLRNEVGVDYRTHRVRLEHALAVSDWATSHKETRVLLALTDGKQGEYVTWLSNLDRKLQLKFGRKGP